MAPRPASPVPGAPSVSIVRATRDHADLARQALTELPERPVDESALREFLDDERRYLLLAVENGLAVGSLYGYALRQPYRVEPQFLLYALDVREGFRRRGIGRALVERFGAEARGAGAYEMWVLTSASNEAGMRLYERCGMRRENPDDVMWVLSLEPTRGPMR
ncbi:MAG TPA: GNAT family N-acetyltransferase [Candidatus Eisenbacteria bacterium]|nr:GNAT family N-acetyltransferase [Candidatus Eisenbacteria bacterium]